MNAFSYYFAPETPAILSFSWLHDRSLGCFGFICGNFIPCICICSNFAVIIYMFYFILSQVKMLCIPVEKLDLAKVNKIVLSDCPQGAWLGTSITKNHVGRRRDKALPWTMCLCKNFTFPNNPPQYPLPLIIFLVLPVRHPLASFSLTVIPLYFSLTTESLQHLAHATWTQLPLSLSPSSRLHSVCVFPFLPSHYCMSALIYPNKLMLKIFLCCLSY